ncbi:Ripening-related protein 3 [Rhynchospora pubera]|uniref:Ripening-related protein 3 n=1 Tax=Rhynchospora pubera TaxID=906938 RepID=A0AAV8DYS2_9POAL|nr:Ripening-related protein 3 [Rhynchospora pubera]
MPNTNSSIPLLISLLILLSLTSLNRAAIRILIGTCHASGFLTGKAGFCTTQNYASCCQTGELYPQYRCSPAVTNITNAKLDVGGFSQGSDGGAAAECDGNFHSDNDLVVALPTGWYNGGRRCLKKIRINGNGKSVLAKVVDECDSVNGCTADQNYEPPCPPDVINASPGVWNALGIPTSKMEVPITWSDA